MRSSSRATKANAVTSRYNLWLCGSLGGGGRGGWAAYRRYVSNDSNEANKIAMIRMVVEVGSRAGVPSPITLSQSSFCLGLFTGPFLVEKPGVSHLQHTIVHMLELEICGEYKLMYTCISDIQFV